MLDFLRPLANWRRCQSLLAFPQALPGLEGDSEVVEGVEVAVLRPLQDHLVVEVVVVILCSSGRSSRHRCPQWSYPIGKA